MCKNYPLTTTIKQAEYMLLSESKTNWTLVRRSTMAVNLEDCPGDKISATDLAFFLSGQLYDNTLGKKSPFIANV
jgi:hypothetical protein